jgi:hypothetical protein
MTCHSPLLLTSYLHNVRDAFGLVEGVLFEVAHQAETVVEFTQAVLKPMEVQVVEVVFDVLPGVESLFGDIFRNFALVFNHAVSNTLVHQLVSLLSVILIIVNRAYLRQGLVGLFLCTIRDLCHN